MLDIDCFYAVWQTLNLHGLMNETHKGRLKLFQTAANQTWLYRQLSALKNQTAPLS